MEALEENNKSRARAVRFSNLGDNLDDKAKADKLNEYCVDSVNQIHDCISEYNLNETENAVNQNSSNKWSLFEPIDMTQLRNTVMNLKNVQDSITL